MQHAKHKGFSLVELLAVIAVIAILIALVVTSAGRVVQRFQLTQTGMRVVEAIDNARATALGRNLPVELWFLRVPPEDGGGEEAYRAVRARILETDGNASWVSRTQRFPDGIVISPSQKHSNCIAGQNPTTVPDLPGNTDGVAVRFHPNGRAEALTPATDNGGTSLLRLDEPLFLTIVGKQTPDGDAENLPDNFITLQIEPRTGQVTTFRP